MDQPQTDLQRALAEFDFVRFTIADVHGVARSKTAPKSSYEEFFKNGVGYFIASCWVGLDGGMAAVAAYVDHPDTRGRGTGNAVARPIAGTLHRLPASGDHEFKLGQVLCELAYPWNGTIQEECPRYLARRTLEKLERLGYVIYGSAEIEFLLVDKETLEPVDTIPAEIMGGLSFARFEKVLLEVSAALEANDIKVELMHGEYAPGQFEFALKPQLGIKIADNVFLAKNFLREVAAKHGYNVVFMTNYDNDDLSNGLHLNHSLKGASDGSYTFSDTSRKDGLSHVFRAWMGGLVNHSSALVCLSNPTVNCYKRLARPWAPSLSNWGVEDRTASFRVKNDSPSGTYVESRLASGSANPYLALAALVSAGMDGIVSKLPCPLPLTDLDSESDRLSYDKSIAAASVPPSLSDALDALQKDRAMVAEVGEHFVKWFAVLKRDEIQKILGVAVGEKDRLTLEKKMYAHLI